MPYHIAMDLLLTGRWMDAQEAHRWGLVNEILPTEKLMERASALSEMLASGTPLVFAAIKEVARAAWRMTFHDAMTRLPKRQLPPRDALSARQAPHTLLHPFPQQ